MVRAPLRFRLAKAILGSHAKEFIPALNPIKGVDFGAASRLSNFTSKQEQLKANLGWCYASNSAIVEPSPQSS